LDDKLFQNKETSDENTTTFPHSGYDMRQLRTTCETGTLKKCSGISHREVNLEKYEALVEYDSTLLTYETMASVLKDAGYTMGKSVD
jgi:hypothetical protein